MKILTGEQVEEFARELINKFEIPLNDSYTQVEFEKELLKLFIAGIELGRTINTNT